MTKEAVISNPLLLLDPNLAAQAIISSNHESSMSILGIARGRIPGTEIVAHFLIYKVIESTNRLFISEEFYDQLRIVFNAIRSRHIDELHRWVESAPGRMKDKR